MEKVQRSTMRLLYNVDVFIFLFLDYTGIETPESPNC